MRTLADAGVDALITNYPDVAVSLLEDNSNAISK